MQIVRKWTEQCRGVTWYYVEHIRDGKQVLSYSNYADPADSQSSPFASASPAVTSNVSPFVRTDGPEE